MRICTIDEMLDLNMSYKYCYDTPSFHINAMDKTSTLLCMLFGDPKNKAGIIGGVSDDVLKIPYSSPFAMMEFFKSSKMEDIDLYVDEFNAYTYEQGIRTIYFKLPPLFYDETNISKLINALIRIGFYVERTELSYHLFLQEKADYVDKLYKNARKNLNRSMQAGFKMRYCENEQDKRKAYEIIKINRQEKKYNLSMTWNEVYSTIKFIKHDFFLLSKEGTDVASAIIFQVTDDIYQVIYWGDVPGFSEDRPINFLAYFLYNYYRKKGARVLDIGPSMIDGQPNYGLCDFKESIGCDVSCKFILRKDMR